jgi:pimeloyl-ACP methyl ester carboxylesterase
MIGFLIGISVIVVLILTAAISIYSSLEITKIPFLAVPYTPQDFGLAYEEVSFPSHDGLKLIAWFLPAKIPRHTSGGGPPSGVADPSAVTLIVQHGLGSNAGDMLMNTLCLAREGRWNLFYLNFRGHGGSEGRLTSLGPLELRDLESAITFLKRTKPEETRRLGIYGHSLGAAVAIVGAARHPELEAVIAESPFSRASFAVVRFARLFYGIPAFPFMAIALFLAGLRLGVSVRSFAPVEEIGKIAPRPLLLIHAERDERIPLNDMRALMEAAGEPKELWVAPGAGHGEPWMVAKEEFDRRLVGFFRKVFP